jgi:hypothetical protein
LRSDAAANSALPPVSTYQPNSFTAVDLGNSQKVRSLLTSAGVI